MNRRVLLLLPLLICGLASDVGAQQANDQAQQAVARAQALLRQLAQEKAAVEAEVGKLRAENARLEKSAVATEAALEERNAAYAAAAREASAVKSGLERKQKSLARVSEQLREVVGKYKEKAAALRQSEATREDLEAQLAQTQNELADAEKKNLALYRINKDILAEFEQDGAWAGLLRREPFTGLKRVQVENLAQEYEYKMGDQLRESSLEHIVTPPTP